MPFVEVMSNLINKDSINQVWSCENLRHGGLHGCANEFFHIYYYYYYLLSPFTCIFLLLFLMKKFKF